MRGWTIKVFLFWITILGRWRRLRTILSCKILSRKILSCKVYIMRPALISEFNPTSSRFFACKVDLGLWLHFWLLHFCIKCNFWWRCLPREWCWRTWTRSGNGVVWFYPFIMMAVVRMTMVWMWRMLFKFFQYILLLYGVLHFELTAGKSVCKYNNQRTSTSWYNSVALWWKPAMSPRVLFGSFDLDGAFLVSLWAQCVKKVR